MTNQTSVGGAALRSRSEIYDGRSRLRAAGLDALSPALLRFLARHRLWRWPVIGDWLKSWDVARSIELILAEVPRDGLVIDMGAYGCEILPALSRAGYSNLIGIDLEPRLMQLPAPAGVTWQIGDFMAAVGASESAHAITSISVIEHGFDGERLAKAVAAWLKPGGLFIASFDYWPHKIDTSSTRLFGLSWTIFSQDEMNAFLSAAARHGLHPAGEWDLSVADPVIHWAGQHYTFGWLALRKQ